MPVIIATGRMFRSARPYALAAGITEPVVCYQGAVVADPVGGEFLRHVPLPMAEALEVIDATADLGHTVLCYVDDELYVARETPASDAYANFQNLTVHVVGDLAEWLEQPPTKLVTVGEPEEMDALGVVMKARFADRLYIAKSLPHFLEFAAPSVTKGAGVAFVAERLGFAREATVAFGDGENDVELHRVGRLRRRRRQRPRARAGGRGLRVSLRRRRGRRPGDRGATRTCRFRDTPSADERPVDGLAQNWHNSVPGTRTCLT